MAKLISADVARIFQSMYSNKYGKGESQDIIRDVFDALVEILANGDDVHISGFGNLENRMIPERKGYDPVKGVVKMFPPSHVVKFSMSGKLRARIKKSQY